MCTFNTLLLPAAADLDAVNAIAQATLHHGFTAQGNPSIERAVGDGARSFVNASRDCDCGSGLARATRPEAVEPSQRELDKLRAAGWSATKIARWRAQRDDSHAKRAAGFERRHGGPPASALAWAAFVRRVLDDKVAPWIGLFTHDYRGAIATERIDITTVRRPSADAGSVEDQIAEIAEDIPVIFTP